MASGNKKAWVAAAIVGVLGLGVAAYLGGCMQSVRRGLVTALTPEYSPEGDTETLKGVFVDKDAKRQRLDVGLEAVAKGFKAPVDIQFVPGDPKLMVVLEQVGRAVWFDMATGKRGQLLGVEALHEGEQGLLGLAFHPEFVKNGRFFIHYIAAGPENDQTRVEGWAVEPGADLRTAKPSRQSVVLVVDQPYQNHNAGQLAFGPDGMLYVGLGDGGFADDPHNHGQNTTTLLGSMLRLDVDNAKEGQGYAVPADNPFVGKEGHRPEIWAYGLRNPWRYSFAPDGRMVVADVGQDEIEEVTVVGRGENHGWKIREGDQCFEPDEGCQTEGLVDPVYTYNHDEGVSITGGYVYEGARVRGLKGVYLFGDFVSGRLWGMKIPADRAPVKDAMALGKWPLLVSTFGKDASGEVYVANYSDGTIHRFAALSP